MKKRTVNVGFTIVNTTDYFILGEINASYNYGFIGIPNMIEFYRPIGTDLFRIFHLN